MLSTWISLSYSFLHCDNLGELLIMRNITARGVSKGGKFSPALDIRKILQTSEFFTRPSILQTASSRRHQVDLHCINY